MIKTIIYQNKYKDLNLDSVARAILDEGKFENLDGLQIQNLSKQKQVEYVAQDAKLVMNISKHKNYEILDLMNPLSQMYHLTGSVIPVSLHGGIRLLRIS
jgi:hypothetical protein